MDIKRMNSEFYTHWYSSGGSGKGIVFCVIDTGVNEVGHIKNNVLTSPYSFPDISGHGTFVANQMLQICPDASISSYNVFHEGLDGRISVINDTLRHILSSYGDREDVQCIVNMSVGVKAGNVSSSVKQMEDLIDELTSHDIAVFVAAGNDGGRHLDIYPSCFHSPICISAINNDGTTSSFSAWHGQVDFADIGMNIQSYNQYGEVKIMSGTSMACPIVAAKAGLVCSEHIQRTGHRMPENDLYHSLKKSALDMGSKGYDEYTGYGFICLNPSL